jgi:membrane protein implicated in regulation of membrane protease activity
MGILTLFGKKNAQDREFSPETIVGKKCVVTDRIDTFAGCGQVKVNGQSWSARGTYDDDVFEVGEVLNIVAIEGVRLICVKA